MFLNKFGLSLNLDLNLFLKGKSSPRLGPKPSRPTLPHSPFGRHLSSFPRRPAHPSPHVSAAGGDVVLISSAPRAGCLNSASLPSSPPIAASLEAKTTSWQEHSIPGTSASELDAKLNGSPCPAHRLPNPFFSLRRQSAQHS